VNLRLLAEETVRGAGAIQLGSPLLDLTLRMLDSPCKLKAGNQTGEQRRGPRQKGLEVPTGGSWRLNRWEMAILGLTYCADYSTSSNYKERTIDHNRGGRAQTPPIYLLISRPSLVQSVAASHHNHTKSHRQPAQFRCKVVTPPDPSPPWRSGMIHGHRGRLFIQRPPVRNGLSRSSTLLTIPISFSDWLQSC
jgi:hypothetical protein